MLDDEEIPCDLVVMSCDDAEGTCYITTANLDGETNLKVLIIETNDFFPMFSNVLLSYILL